VAIGECGLDYYRLEPDDHISKERQKKAFMEQVYLAKDLEKPLMIHCRNAFGDLIDILDANRDALLEFPGVIHFFSGGMEEAQALLDMGFSFTFGGVVTFARDYDEVIKFLPLGNILSETDAPYVAPAPYRGKRNEPAYVVETVKKLAELKGIKIEEMAEQINKNVSSVFRV
ncbi:MAG: TatD family hydrolase, partial [Candidatus Liptonbacteria bacterium]|nr:TatD family hydrolase [Candidatus Liptonbacteria bacterium]